MTIYKLKNKYTGERVLTWAVRHHLGVLCMDLSYSLTGRSFSLKSLNRLFEILIELKSKDILDKLEVEAFSLYQIESKVTKDRLIDKINQKLTFNALKDQK